MPRGGQTTSSSGVEYCQCWFTRRTCNTHCGCGASCQNCACHGGQSGEDKAPEEGKARKARDADKEKKTKGGNGARKRDDKLGDKVKKSSRESKVSSSAHCIHLLTCPQQESKSDGNKHPDVRDPPSAHSFQSTPQDDRLAFPPPQATPELHARQDARASVCTASVDPLAPPRPRHAATPSGAHPVSRPRPSAETSNSAAPAASWSAQRPLQQVATAPSQQPLYHDPTPRPQPGYTCPSHPSQARDVPSASVHNPPYTSRLQATSQAEHSRHAQPTPAVPKPKPATQEAHRGTHRSSVLSTAASSRVSARTAEQTSTSVGTSATKSTSTLRGQALPPAVPPYSAPSRAPVGTGSPVAHAASFQSPPAARWPLPHSVTVPSSPVRAPPPQYQRSVAPPNPEDVHRVYGASLTVPPPLPLMHPYHMPVVALPAQIHNKSAQPTAAPVITQNPGSIRLSSSSTHTPHNALGACKVIKFHDATQAHYGFANSSPHPVVYKRRTYPTSEHLFQSLRVRPFDRAQTRVLIRTVTVRTSA